jgi:hypothetical protein
MGHRNNERVLENTIERLALSRRSAARALDRSEGYLRLREKCGDGPPFARCGRAVFYPLEDLKVWLKRNSVSVGRAAAEERGST